jgi:hypothetical protein
VNAGMPLSVTCQCGARLEIDEKFLGKDIPCPDCQRLLPTKLPVAPTAVDLPNVRRVSGLATLSLSMALVGAFIPGVNLAAAVVGFLALRQVAANPRKLEGAGIARAGIITGSVAFVLTLFLLFLHPFFGIDTPLREMIFASHVDYPTTNEIQSPPSPVNVTIEIKRPVDSGPWGKYISGSSQSVPNKDTLIIVSVPDDAQIVCIAENPDGFRGENADDRKKKVLERFYKSELVNLLGRLKGRALDHEGDIIEEKASPDGNRQEILLDLRLAGIDRRFVIQYWEPEVGTLNMLVAGTRKNRFDRLLPEFRKAFESANFNK